MKIRHSAPGLILAFCVVSFSIVALPAPAANAQSAVLAEVYGRGVHAYHAGRYADAYEFLSMAIGAGLENPLAYYFRGLAADASGRQYEAEADFQAGADLEARGPYAEEIGRSLVRVQGPLRLQLESIREKARLQALATSNARSQIRYGELGAQQPGASINAAPGQPVAPGIAPPRVPTPPPAPAAENPFADDIGDEPMVESNDAFAGAEDNPLANPNAATQPNAPKAAAPAGSDPFSAPAGNADPFSAPAEGADPFSAPAAADDPFGASPF